MANPCENLSPDAFWRSAVSKRNVLQIHDLWHPKIRLFPKHKIVTAGSSFAHLIGRAFAARGYQWLDAEPAPF